MLTLSLSLINSSTARVASTSSAVLNQPSVLKSIMGAENGGGRAQYRTLTWGAQIHPLKQTKLSSSNESYTDPTVLNKSYTDPTVHPQFTDANPTPIPTVQVRLLHGFLQ